MNLVISSALLLQSILCPPKYTLICHSRQPGGIGTGKILVQTTECVENRYFKRWTVTGWHYGPCAHDIEPLCEAYGCEEDKTSNNKRHP